MSPCSPLKYAPILAVAAGLVACDRSEPNAPPAPMAPVAPGVTETGSAEPPAPASEAVETQDPRPAAPAPNTPAQPAPVPPSPTPSATGARWDVSRNGGGAVATLTGSRGVLLRIACVAQPGRLKVEVPTFRPVGSEDRLSIGFGNDPIALVANLRARGDGVTARGELPPNIAGRILRSRSISVNYGSQNAGPFDPPRGQDAMTLANACADAAGSRPPLPGDAEEGVLRQIPASFRGEWNMRLQDCGTGLNDSRLDVGARTVLFYESRGEVTEVVRQGPRAISVAARYTGEGETWNRTTRMTLSRSGDELTIDGTTRRRCPTGGERPGRRAER